MEQKRDTDKKVQGPYKAEKQKKLTPSKRKILECVPAATTDCSLKKNRKCISTSGNNSTSASKINNKKLRKLTFKNPKYRESGFTATTKVWKNLKQIISSQKSQPSPVEVPYALIDAPPPTKPIKKYSDLSGLPALYTDPRTKLQYSNSEEYQRIQTLSSEIVMGLLMLRKAAA